MIPSSPATPAIGPVVGLPPGWSTCAPGAGDVADLVALLRRHQTTYAGSASVTDVDVAAHVVGRGASVRQHLLVRDGHAKAVGWATVRDRAAGRVLLDVVVAPDAGLAAANGLASALFAWGDARAAVIARRRRLAETQIDSGAYADDERQRRWLLDRGFTLTRSWWQMSRAVTPADALPGAFPPPHDEVNIRPVVRDAAGMPDEHDLRTIHDVLETAFADHFNSHAETFDEFVSRLREDPGHRWDHWWIAELARLGVSEPAGALVASATPPPVDSRQGPAAGSYVDYIGVLPSARGRGVAKALLHTVIADAARRGRDHVGLEVDADSPTGAEGMYAAMGWTTSYVTQSWHREIPVPAPDPS